MELRQLFGIILSVAIQLGVFWVLILLIRDPSRFLRLLHYYGPVRLHRTKDGPLFRPEVEKRLLVAIRVFASVLLLFNFAFAVAFAVLLFKTTGNA